MELDGISASTAFLEGRPFFSEAVDVFSKIRDLGIAEWFLILGSNGAKKEPNPTARKRS